MRRRGTVLLMVLVFTAAGAMLAATLVFRMTAEVAMSTAARDGRQGQQAAMAGIERAMALVRSNPNEPSAWLDNPEALSNQFVCEADGLKWYFSVYAYNPADPRSARAGVTDESGKINVNLADEATLRRLLTPLAPLSPGVAVDELVDCLIDFRDADSLPRPHGAEQEYYDSLNPPYLARNGPLTTLGELTMVKGFSTALVYGEDANLNGLLEPGEDDGDETFPSDNADGRLDTGLRHVATAGQTYGPDVDSQGRARADMNDPAAAGKAGLSEETATFIRLYVEDGQTFTHPAQLLEMEYKLTKDNGTYKAGETVRSGVGPEQLPDVLDRLTVPGGRPGVEVGRVNVNTAPRAVLAAMPEVGAELADRIAEARRELDGQARRTTAWLYGPGLVEDAATFRKLAPLFRCRGYQYHVQCVAYSQPAGQFRVLEAVVDLAGGAGQIVYLRDLTHLGIPLPLGGPAAVKKE